MINSILKKLKKRKRNEETEKLLFDMFYHKVYKTAYYIVKDHHIAQDIVQKTFIKAFQHIDSVKDGNKLGGWLKVIATTTAIDYLRKHKKWNEVDIDNVYNKEVSAAVDSWSVEKQVEKEFLEQEIKRFIHMLDIKYQEVLLLKYYGELKEEEIAVTLNLKLGTVKSRINRAKNKLKPLIESHVKEGDIE